MEVLMGRPPTCHSSYVIGRINMCVTDILSEPFCYSRDLSRQAHPFHVDPSHNRYLRDELAKGMVSTLSEFLPGDPDFTARDLIESMRDSQKP